MVIENRSLTPGTRLVASYKKERYACIVGVEDGKTVFTLEDGRSFKSPSAAGSALMGGMACNGWRFWSIEGEAPAPTGETPEKPAKAAKAKANGEHRAIKRVPNQKGVAEGNTRYFCDGCMKAFEHPIDQGAPAACPEGHPAVLRDELPVA
jgi:hypothetical protein